MAAANALNRGDDDAGFFRRFQIPDSKKEKKPSRFKNKTEEANQEMSRPNRKGDEIHPLEF